MEIKFDKYYDKTNNEIAASILVLAEVLDDRLGPNLGSEICMGIRHGIFGYNADIGKTIDDTFKKND